MYADRLFELEPAPDWLVEHTFVLLGRDGAMVLISYDDEAVTSVSPVPAATPRKAASHLAFGC